MSLPGTLQIVLIALGTGLLVGSITAWWFTDSYKETKFETERAEHVAQVATIRATSAERLLAAEQSRSQIQGELQNEKAQLIEDHSARIAGLSTTIADVSKLRLRDPGSDRNSGSSASSGNPGGTSGDPSGTARTGLLSKEATEFLWSYGTEADRTLETLRSCQIWVEKVEDAAKKYQESLKPQTE